MWMLERGEVRIGIAVQTTGGVALLATLGQKAPFGQTIGVVEPGGQYLPAGHRPEHEGPAWCAISRESPRDPPEHGKGYSIAQGGSSAGGALLTSVRSCPVAMI